MRADAGAAVARDAVTQSRPRRRISCVGDTFVIRVRLSDGRVEEAWSTGRMLRNVNVLLRDGLDAEGRPTFIQQAHCLCNDGHALAAIRALEDLAGATPPRMALATRSLIQALRCIQEHLRHFYQFHLADWASLRVALRADPAAAARLDEGSGRDADIFVRARARLESLAGARGEAVAAEDFADHPELDGPDGLHLLLHAHGLDALRVGLVLNEALALLGCGSEGFRAYCPGGLPDDLDLGPAALDPLRGRLAEIDRFLRRTFLPDLQRLARTYGRWAAVGRGNAFFSWPDVTLPGGEARLFPGGVVVPADGTWTARPACWEAVAEDRDPAWSDADRDRYRLRPEAGGPAFDWNAGQFFWLPAPRHDGEACEAGPLARVAAGLAHGREPVRRAAEAVLAGCGLDSAALNSTLGRVLARGVESLALSDAAAALLEELAACGGRGERRVELRLPESGLGVGRVEAPRGALTHAIRLEGGRIAAHDYLIPSLWNFSPRDAGGGRGPLELALIGSAVADPARPLELLRTIHELDPCNACVVVVEDRDSGRSFVAEAK